MRILILILVSFWFIVSVQADWQPTWGNIGDAVNSPNSRGYVGMVFEGGSKNAPFVFEADATGGYATFSNAAYRYTWQSGVHGSNPWTKVGSDCGETSTVYYTSTYARLSVAIPDGTDTSDISVTNYTNGAGAGSFLAGNGVVMIGNEQISYTSFIVDSGNPAAGTGVGHFSGITRGANSTTGVAHPTSDDTEGDTFTRVLPTCGGNATPLMPPSRHPGFTSTFRTADNCIYQVAGYYEVGRYGDLWKKCNDDVWVQVQYSSGGARPSILRTVEASAVMDNYDDVLYYFAGAWNGSNTATIYVYVFQADPQPSGRNVGCTAANTWCIVTSYGTSSWATDTGLADIPRMPNLVFDSVSHKVLIYGGANDSNQAMDDLVSFDPVTHNFAVVSTTGTPPTFTGTNFSIAAIDDVNHYLFVPPGDGSTTHYLLNLSTLVWTTVTIAGGGPEQDGTGKSASMVYDPNQGTYGAFIGIDNPGADNSCSSCPVRTWELLIDFYAASVSAQLTVQEALGGVSGITRTADPVTAGIPLADSENVASVNQLGLDGAAAGQFRCLTEWPSGNCKWVLVDFQESVTADSTSTAVSLVGGSGNFGGSNLATDNGATITVNTSTGGCEFTLKKANYDGLNKVDCGGTVLVDGSLTASDGLVVAAHAQSATPSTWSTCTFNSDCTTVYKSSNDADSTCTIEENGPVRAVVKCSGALEDASNNIYMRFLVRVHLYLGKPYIQTVVTLKNADEGGSSTFASAFKGFQAFEWRIATQLTGTNSFAFSNHTATPTTGTIGAGTNTYLYQAHSNSLEDIGYNNTWVVPPVTRDVSFNYAQEGYQIRNNTTTVQTGTKSQYPEGWGDVYDSVSGAGIEVGHYQMGGYWPKSIQFQNGGLEVRIGIWPDQTLWTESCTPDVTPCQGIYYQSWPQYSIHDTFLIFHTSALGTTAESANFKKLQYPLIARAARTYYNSAGVFLYPIVDATAEDNYWTGVNANFGLPTDVSPHVFRAYAWGQGGGGNQLELRYDHLVHHWIARAWTGAYLYARHFYRYQEEKVYTRADGFTWIAHTPQSDLEAWGLPSVDTVTSLNGTGSFQNDIQDHEHEHVWGMVDYYNMTGDEDAADQLEDGFYNRYGNQSATVKMNLPSGQNNLWNSRAFGSNMSSCYRTWDYLRSVGLTTPAANVLTSCDNLFANINQELCTQDANAVKYPTGCVITYVVNDSLGNDRGVSSYRGIGFGPNDQAADQGNCNEVTGERCSQQFMEAILVEGLMEASLIRGSTWQYYQRGLDLAYGIGKFVDSEAWTTGGADYTDRGLKRFLTVDRANTGVANPAGTMAFVSNYGGGTGDAGQTWGFIYYGQARYLNTATALQTHFNTLLESIAYYASSWNLNSIDEYGGHLVSGVMDLLLTPPSTTLQTVTLGTSYAAGPGEWTLSWTPPAGVTAYYLKEHDTKTIVDWIGWNSSTDLPTGDAVNTYNWFAASDTASQPAAGDSQIVVTAPSTASFMLKALATVAAPQFCCRP